MRWICFAWCYTCYCTVVQFDLLNFKLVVSSHFHLFSFAHSSVCISSWFPGN
uniref:Uncharacterized protein n=1 Tax=Arundo donax TaxID=35708 RepID=A0A0A9GP99_ARUDO